MIYKKLILIVFLVFILPTLSSEVILSLDSSTDIYQDTFYISKNISKEVNFSLTSDLSSTFQNNYRAEYQLTEYSNNPQLFLSLSKQEETFVSNINSSFSLNIRSLDFKDDTVRLRVKVSIYDVYDNLVEDDYLYLRLVSNNSEYEFSDAPKNKVPEYKGYSLSRDKMFILNKYDKDKITIKNHVDKIYYGLDCSVNKEGLTIDLRYKGDNYYTLETSLSDYNISKDTFEINCYSYYRDNLYSLRPITVNYLDQNIFYEEILEEEIVEKSKLSVFFENLFKKLL